VDVWGNSGMEGWSPHRKTDQSSDWAYASLEDVRANLESTQYSMNQVFFVKGMVEETLPATAPDSIALLRLDTDWYSSTRHELEHLYPRLSQNGVLILDDYGHFMGARKATDEYFKTLNMPPLLSRVDYAGRIAIKVQ
jgi:O-methyltransferase